MDQKEIMKIQEYLRKTFSNEKIAVVKGEGGIVEVLIDDEFIGAIYKNEDEDELSYDFMMSILSEDLE